jgi:transglutaminase-like putative cysteine protease
VHFLIRHLTRYDFAAPITENVMHLHLEPRSDGSQRCLSFDLTVEPSARIFSYRDYLGNRVHHFDVAGPHSELIVLSEALVETLSVPPLPTCLPPYTWGLLDELIETEDFWEMLLPSRFARPTPLLHELMAEIGVHRDEDDPLTLIRRVSDGISATMEYAPESTRVDSPIDEALEARRGVCQDYAHIMIAMLRELKVPARYVSGYLYHREVGEVYLANDATHAWVEILLPERGWVGFDPTTNHPAGPRHIRTAIGRDYADIPPTRGVYKGDTESLLSVSVKVWPWGAGLSTLPPEAPPPPAVDEMRQRAAERAAGASGRPMQQVGLDHDQ